MANLDNIKENFLHDFIKLCKKYNIVHVNDDCNISLRFRALRDNVYECNISNDKIRKALNINVHKNKIKSLFKVGYWCNYYENNKLHNAKIKGFAKDHIIVTTLNGEFINTKKISYSQIDYEHLLTKN